MKPLNKLEASIIAFCYVAFSGCLGIILGSLVGHSKSAAPWDYLHHYIGVGFLGAIALPLMVTIWYLPLYVGKGNGNVG